MTELVELTETIATTESSGRDSKDDSFMVEKAILLWYHGFNKGLEKRKTTLKSITLLLHLDSS